MSNNVDVTPILIGVGQVTEPVPENLTHASSNVDLAAKAALQAIQDTDCPTLTEHIDVVAMARTFPDSSPAYPAPFGRSNNPPRSVASRLGFQPKEAVYSKIGGNTPQALVNEYCARLHSGAAQVVLLCGAEVQANSRVASKQDAKLNWSEAIDGPLDDRGLSTDNLFTQQEMTHQVLQPMQYYALMENARCAASEQAVNEYRYAMGKLFTRFSAVAATNPLATDQTAYTAEQLVEPSEQNPMVVWPYTKRLISKDSVNQSAALVLTTVGKAKALGIDPSKWVYLHGSADVADRFLLERQELGQSHALRSGLEGALTSAGQTPDSIRYFDLYSCFPIVVAEAMRALGLAENDPRPLTLTGGLPYFGGPGNNYSMHAIAEMARSLRADPGQFGLVLANGGWMSKISVGVYSTAAPKNWHPQNSAEWQRQVDDHPTFPMQPKPQGEAVIDSFTAFLHAGKPVRPLVIGRLLESNERFYAVPADNGEQFAARFSKHKLIGQRIFVDHEPNGNRFSFDAETLTKAMPTRTNSWRESYQYCRVERDKHVVTITLNRPDVGNALHPPANTELDEIFNAYEADDSLRVAIVTGAGDAHFCTGNDLKYMASGKPLFVPDSGFGGLTSRVKRSKPVIAALNGDAMGGGLEIALACDLMVVAEHARLALPEVKVGLFAGAGGVQRLTRQIGLKPAMQMLLTGQPITAQRAAELGLANDVVPLSNLSDRVSELARQIASVSPHAIKCTFGVLSATAQYADADTAVTTEHGVFDTLINGHDFWEGPRAFAEKRRPNWRK